MKFKKRFKRAKHWLLATCTTLLTLFIYSFFIEPNLFVVVPHYLNQSISQQTETIKLVQISDLHLRNFNSRAEKIGDRINQLKPDLILFTGDIVDRPNKLEELNKFLAIVDLNIPKYAILGNWEHWGGVNLKALSEVYKGYNCQLLINQSINFKTSPNKSILITGLDDFTGGKPNLTGSLAGTTPNPNHLILAHSPVYIDCISPEEKTLLTGYGSQYMLSGHTHGGQIVFFGFAPLRPPGRFLSGWYKDKDSLTSIYVSRGLGVSSIPFRMGAVPEIAYFEWSLN